MNKDELIEVFMPLLYPLVPDPDKEYMEGIAEACAEAAERVMSREWVRVEGLQNIIEHHSTVATEKGVSELSDFIGDLQAFILYSRALPTPPKQ